jgi:electron transfer flavoprotein beta subunit
MKILVCAKRVVDYNVKVRVKADQRGVELANVKMSMNPFDEIAVEEAVRLKEKGVASEVIVLSIGDDKVQEVIRSAIALGADRGVQIKTDQAIEPLVAAKLIAKVVEKESPELVILGKQAIDDDANQTGQKLAAILNWPQGTFASELEIAGGNAKVTREVDGGLAVHELTLPAVITTDLRLNEPRYAKLPDIMKARSKPLDVIELADLGVDASPKLVVSKVEEPAGRSGGIKVSSVDELIDKLKNEAKVI